MKEKLCKSTMTYLLYNSKEPLCLQLNKPARKNYSLVNQCLCKGKMSRVRGKGRKLTPFVTMISLVKQE